MIFGLQKAIKIEVKQLHLPEHLHPEGPTLEWQVFRHTGNAEKSRKLRTQRKIGENSKFASQNKNTKEKHRFMNSLK